MSTMRRVPAALVASWLCFATGARADTVEDEPWKDGCPARFAPEHVPSALADLPTHTGAASFGAQPELDSPLGPSRIATAAWSNQVVQQSTGVAQPWLLGGEAVLHIASTSGPFFTLTQAAVRTIDSEPLLSRWGNTRAFVGYRRAGYVLGTAFRVAGAIRLGGGSNPGADSSAPAVQEREKFATWAPFREELFGFQSPTTLTLESRIEMVGCHAPFVDLRVDGSTWRPHDASSTTPYERVYVVPIAVAIGGYFLPRNALYGEFAWEYRARLDYSHVTRVSVGWEGRLVREQPHSGPFGDVHLGARFSALTGDNITGWDIMTTLGWQFGWQGRLE